MREWKERRNTLIHGLVRQQLTTEDLAELADEGHELVKELNKRSANYKKAVERKNTAK